MTEATKLHQAVRYDPVRYGRHVKVAELCNRGIELHLPKLFVNRMPVLARPLYRSNFIIQLCN